jgi:hypothetical protein
MTPRKKGRFQHNARSVSVIDRKAICAVQAQGRAVPSDLNPSGSNTLPTLRKFLHGLFLNCG